MAMQIGDYELLCVLNVFFTQWKWADSILTLSQRATPYIMVEDLKLLLETFKKFCDVFL